MKSTRLVPHSKNPFFIRYVAFALRRVTRTATGVGEFSACGSTAAGATAQHFIYAQFIRVMNRFNYPKRRQHPWHTALRQKLLLLCVRNVCAYNMDVICARKLE